MSAPTRMISINLLDVDEANVRLDDLEGLDELASSIAEQGVLQPLLVRPRTGGRFGVVAGQRRLAGARAAGCIEVPCVVRQLDDVQAAVASATENLARVDLDPITEAETYRALLDATGATQNALAVRLGVSPSTVSGRLQLLELPGDLCESIRAGQVSVGAARRMVGKVRRAKASRSPARPRHVVGADNVDMLDAVVVDVDTLALIRRSIDPRVDDVTSFVARAITRELDLPSCHARGCHAPTAGPGRFCPAHLTQLRRIREQLQRRMSNRARAEGKATEGTNLGREIAQAAAVQATELLVHGPERDSDLAVAHG